MDVGTAKPTPGSVEVWRTICWTSSTSGTRRASPSTSAPRQPSWTTSRRAAVERSSSAAPDSTCARRWTASRSRPRTRGCAAASRRSSPWPGPPRCTRGWRPVTPRPPRTSSRRTGGASCALWRSTRSPAGRSGRPFPTASTCVPPSRWVSTCRGGSSTRASPQGWTGCGGTGSSTRCGPWRRRGLRGHAHRVAGAGLRAGAADARRRAHRVAGEGGDGRRDTAVRPAPGVVVPARPARHVAALRRP